MLRAVKKLSHRTCMSPDEGEKGDTLPFYFSLYSKQVSFTSVLGATFLFCIFMLFVDDFTVSDDPQEQ